MNNKTKKDVTGFDLTICLPKRKDYAENYWVDNPEHSKTKYLWKGILIVQPSDYFNVCADVTTDSNKLSKNMIIIISCSCVAAVLLIVALIIILVIRKKKNESNLQLKKKNLLLTSEIIEKFG